MKIYLKFCLYLIICLLNLTITGCNFYQKKFGGKSADYTKASPGKKLQSNNSGYLLNKSNRYAIPAVNQKWTGPITDLNPPDYINATTNKN